VHANARFRLQESTASADTTRAMLNLSGRENTSAPGTRASARFGELRLRKPFGVSAILHVAAGAALVYASQADATPPRLLFHQPKTALVYVAVVPVEIPVIELAKLELRAPEPVRSEEPAPPRPMPEVAPIFESKRVEVANAVELPIAPPVTPPPVAAPKKPEVTTGMFGDAAAPVRTPEPARQIEIAGFDRTVNQPIEMKPATTTVGAFERQVNSGPPKGGPSQG